MKIKYASPIVSAQTLEIPAQTQYIFIVTFENCSGLAYNSDQAKFFENNTFAHCDNDELETIQSQPDDNLFVTCLDIEGTFTISTHSAETELGGALNCNIDEISVIAPFSVSPALPADCIITSFIQEGESDNICTGPI